MKTKLLLLLFVLTCGFVNAQENASKPATPGKTIQPKIMVVPKIAENGPDMKTIYDNDMNMQIAIAKINEAFQKHGANLRNFDQVYKQIKENQMINKSSGNADDTKTLILQSSGADIYVEVKLDVVPHPSRNAKSVTLILDASQTGTGNSLATRTVAGPMFQTDDVGKLTMMAMDTVTESFLNLLQLKFDDIVLNGQSVFVQFTAAPGGKYNLDSEIGTDAKPLSEILDDWFQAHAKNGQYNNQGVVGNQMIISDVRIPLKKPDNPNQNYTGQNLYTDISKYLKSIGVSSKREIGTNNKILITIL